MAVANSDGGCGRSLVYAQEVKGSVVLPRLEHIPHPARRWPRCPGLLRTASGTGLVSDHLSRGNKGEEGTFGGIEVWRGDPGAEPRRTGCACLPQGRNERLAAG